MSERQKERFERGRKGRAQLKNYFPTCQVKVVTFLKIVLSLPPSFLLPPPRTSTASARSQWAVSDPNTQSQATKQPQTQTQKQAHNHNDNNNSHSHNHNTQQQTHNNSTQPQRTSKNMQNTTRSHNNTFDYLCVWHFAWQVLTG